MAKEQAQYDSQVQTRLFNAAMDLFARYGYEGTTVRMIAKKAGVSAGQVTFYFGSKENLFSEILQHIVRQTKAVYDPICDQIGSLKQAGRLDRVTAMEYLQLIVNLQIDFALNPDNYYDLMIIFAQKMDSPAEHDAVTHAIIGKIELLAAELLAAASGGKMSMLKARTISRAINGAIISFGEHPDLLMVEVHDAGEDAFAKLHLANFIRAAINEAIRTSAD